MYLFNFKPVAPRYMTDQSSGNRWLAAAHLRSELSRKGMHVAEELLERKLSGMVEHYGCPSKSIETRGHECSDFRHTDWGKMEIYPLDTRSEGVSMGERMDIYRKSALRAFEEWYPSKTEGRPDDLIHVTCTGYRSPSVAQEICSARRWFDTRVTHLYHMGCYASVPALRLATGFLARNGSKGPSVHVAHTELCTLHLNPSIHTPEQLIVQSLFADGMIRYDVSAGTPESSSGNSKRSLKILNVKEKLLPDTSDMMTWVPQSWGIQMSLSKEVPMKIAWQLKGFIEEMLSESGLSYKEIKRDALFAVHPGGPRILDQIEDFLRLDASQLLYSRKILRERGNMSSSTLPYIWNEILSDEAVPVGKKVVSLAFGPGLTIAGVAMEVAG